MLCVSEEIPVSHEEIVELHRKLDAVMEALSKSAEDRAIMRTEIKQLCTCMETLTETVKGPGGLETRQTKTEGKMSLIMWIAGAFATAGIGCLVAGIWAIAFKV